MNLQTVEYLIRARFQEPPGVEIGDDMHLVLGEIEMLADEQEIVSRVVDPDCPRPPKRQQCPTSATWHGRHFVTDRRWTITTPENVETVLCSAACTVTWLCSVLPADFQIARHRETPEGSTAGRYRVPSLPGQGAPIGAEGSTAA